MIKNVKRKLRTSSPRNQRPDILQARSLLSKFCLLGDWQDIATWATWATWATSTWAATAAAAAVTWTATASTVRECHSAASPTATGVGDTPAGALVQNARQLLMREQSFEDRQSTTSVDVRRTTLGLLQG